VKLVVPLGVWVDKVDLQGIEAWKFGLNLNGSEYGPLNRREPRFLRRSNTLTRQNFVSNFNFSQSSLTYCLKHRDRPETVEHAVNVFGIILTLFARL